MKVQIKYRGQVLATTIPNPTIGQFVTLAAGDTRIRLYWDGKRFVLPQAHVVDTAQVVAAAVEEVEEDIAPRDLPDWVYESRDPRIVSLREQSGPNYDAFIEARAAGAWQQGLLYQEMRAERKARTGAGDDLEVALAEWAGGGGESYCDGCPSRCAECPQEVNRPETVEGRLVWALAGRLTGAVRRDPGGGFDGFDLPSAFAMAAALQIPAVAVAELMPSIDAGFRHASREADRKRREEAEEAER